MEKTKKWFFKMSVAAVVAIVCLLSFGCAGTNIAHSGEGFLPINQTSVVLDGSRNFKYVQQGVQSRAKSTYVLGIGGFRDGLTGEAKASLLRRGQLKPNQAFVNVSVDTQVGTFLGIITVVNRTITADIIEFEVDNFGEN